MQALAGVAAALTIAFPSPGASSALRGTEISLRGVTPAQAGAITVTGSRSGGHAGTLRPHPEGRGVSCVPALAFKPGERGTVRNAVTMAV